MGYGTVRERLLDRTSARSLARVFSKDYFCESISRMKRRLCYVFDKALRKCKRTNAICDSPVSRLRLLRQWE
jgi:hypothetical protein